MSTGQHLSIITTQTSREWKVLILGKVWYCYSHALYILFADNSEHFLQNPRESRPNCRRQSAEHATTKILPSNILELYILLKNTEATEITTASTIIFRNGWIKLAITIAARKFFQNDILAMACEVFHDDRIGINYSTLQSQLQHPNYFRIETCKHLC